MDYILFRHNLKEISDCKLVVVKSVAGQLWLEDCRMKLIVRKMKTTKSEQRTWWWKLKKEECCEAFKG